MKLLLIRKIYYNKLIIYYVVVCAIRYNLQKLLLTNSRFLQLIDREEITTERSSFSDIMQHKERLLGLITKVMRHIFPNTKCLVLSLVKRSVLAHYGIQEKIYLGVTLQNETILAHAWLASERPLGHQKIQNI